MKLLRRIKLKTLAPFMFYLSIWDITTDICYLSSRPIVNNFLWWLSIASMTLNLIGPAMILLVGQAFNTFLNTIVFKIEKFSARSFFTESKELIRLSHSFVFKSILNENIPKKKAVYRTAFLIHLSFESFPQLVLQGVTNQKFHIWFEPFAILSFATSLIMIIFTFIIAIKTDKYYL